MDNCGLVLEGGGMRGVYTAGVLDVFMERDLYLPYVIGVSAGACNATSYLSRQHGRNRTVNVDYITHPEYLSYKNWLFKKKGLFGMDFIFDDLPNKHVPFDFESFNKSTEKFVIVATDCHSGNPVYYEKSEHLPHMLTLLRASASLPFMAPVITYQDMHLLDGGISDPVPVKRAVQDGFLRNVIVLTQNKGYRKKKPRMTWLIKKKYPQYEGLFTALVNRYEKYNETLDYIEHEEEKGNVFVIRPSAKLDVGRIERSPAKLSALYDQGRIDTIEAFEGLSDWLSHTKEKITS
ncbi:patatin family protein [Fictibacillus aquaticus]|uniref:Patatin family protein n=1 Tax=Fictibacillus aquaticus TaxID=2021314 RepID=A0A235FCT7_9BACL|nr:patatin family protein [Fictibacillus aquaticus]OYD59200.1 patatin family protein [Fictibacillus aquaticus]